MSGPPQLDYESWLDEKRQRRKRWSNAAFIVAGGVIATPITVIAAFMPGIESREFPLALVCLFPIPTAMLLYASSLPGAGTPGVYGIVAIAWMLLQYLAYSVILAIAYTRRRFRFVFLLLLTVHVVGLTALVMMWKGR